jgi:Fanconi anemia group M protein
MAIRLNFWQAPDSTYIRVFINGLPVNGKVWLENRRTGVAVRTQNGLGDLGDRSEEDVLAEVEALVGSRDWQAIITYSQANKSTGRGAAAKGAAPAPAAPEAKPYVGQDPSTLDANFGEYPLPKPTRLLVDHREPQDLIAKLRSIRNLDVEVCQLDLGDYVVPGKLIIERKAVMDFITSITEDNKRLFHQTERLSNCVEPVVLMVEGDLYNQTRMTLQALTGALSYLGVIQRMSVIPTLSMEHTAYTIAKMVRHAVYGLGYDLRLRSGGPRDPVKAAQFVLEGVPEVSTTRARVLLDHFGSLQAVASASLADLLAVKGIGKVTAQMVFDTFRTDTSRVLEG